MELVAKGTNSACMHKIVTDYIDNRIIKLHSYAARNCTSQIPVSDLVVTKSIGRKLSTYKVNQPHIVLARRLSEKTGVDIPAGTRLEYVFTKNTENGMSTVLELEEEGLEIDSMFYVRKQLATQIDDVLAAIGIGNYIKDTWCGK
jgi:DNA polymerase elongation subunit (family B)